MTELRNMTDFEYVGHVKKISVYTQQCDRALDLLPLQKFVKLQSCDDVWMTTSATIRSLYFVQMMLRRVATSIGSIEIAAHITLNSYFKANHHQDSHMLGQTERVHSPFVLGHFGYAHTLRLSLQTWQKAFRTKALQTCSSS